MSGFAGKVAIVTGGASGIGQATAWALAQAGTIVFAADISLAKLNATVSAPEAAERVRPVQCDVSSESDVKALLAAAEACGPLEFAVNAAGVAQRPSAIDDTSAAEYDRIMAINGRGTFLCLRYQTEAMVKHGRGAIVNIASIAGMGGAHTVQSYTASKHAVVGLTRSSELDVANRGVRVNAVCPGPVDTPMLTEGADAIRIEQAVRYVPVGRLGSPQEIADAALFLLSDRASFIVGTTLVVDGGMTIA